MTPPRLGVPSRRRLSHSSRGRKTSTKGPLLRSDHGENNASVMREPIRVGCSGWQYRHWRGSFYPPGLPQRLWLEYYAARFETVEVNNSFYKLPAKGLLAGWHDRVPANFVFAVKASRYLTHMKKLRAPEAPLDALLQRTRELKPKQGPILYQLPPQLHKNTERLKEFLDGLAHYSTVKHALEFRHPTWYGDDVFTLLEQHDVAMCLHDMVGSASPREPVATFLYVRFHGALGKYAGGYSSPSLSNWTDWLRRQRKPAFVYFNNDVAGQAPKDAITFRTLVARAQAYPLRIHSPEVTGEAREQTWNDWLPAADGPLDT